MTGQANQEPLEQTGEVGHQGHVTDKGSNGFGPLATKNEINSNSICGYITIYRGYIYNFYLSTLEILFMCVYVISSLLLIY